MENLFHKLATNRTFPRSYWLTRFVILRLLGAIYAIAFLVAINEIVPLIGSDGLLPISLYIKQVTDAIGITAGFIRLPSIFWFGHSDATLLIVAWVGFILSCISGCRLCECNYTCYTLVSVYVVCSFRAGLVWIRMGNSIA